MPAQAFFSGLDASTERELGRTAAERTFTDGETLFLRGEPASMVFGLLDGRLKIWWTSEDGAAQTLMLLGPGELVGALAVIQGTISAVTASALGGVRAIAWPASAFRKALKTDLNLTRETLRLVAARMQQVLERLEEITTVPLDQRVARLLLRVALDTGHRPGERSIRLVMTRQDLADLAAVTMPTVSRLMSRWRREGLIDGGRGRIVLNDPGRLSRIAHGGQPATGLRFDDA